MSNLPIRKPNTARETRATLQELGFNSTSRTLNSGSVLDSELIPSNIPADTNVGQPINIKKTIAAAFTKRPDAVPAERKSPQAAIKRSASSELLKIKNLDNYMDACAAYNRGLREGWTGERLLKMIAERQRLDGMRDGKR